MKIYIHCDMEGVSGIRKPEQVLPESPEYEEGRRLMAADVNAAVEGAFAGGATEVVVGDAHYKGGNLRMEELDKRVTLESPSGGRMMPSLGPDFAGVILLGHHARAGTLHGFLDHTMSSASWFEYRINDLVVGEIGIEAAWAGQYQVPVIMVSGDAATAAEAKELLGPISCAVVKHGVDRHHACCLGLEQAHSLIRSAAESAVRQATSCRPYQPSLPAVITLTVYRTDMADELALRPGTRRLDARTLQREITSLGDVCKW